MAIKKPQEFATIDVVLVMITKGADSYAIKTSNKVAVSPVISTVDAITLVSKGVLIAQKPASKTLTGHDIVLTNSTFIPEEVAIFQGGTVTYDAVETTKVTGYEPLAVGAEPYTDTCSVDLYTAIRSASGQITQYEKTSYPNCSGDPIGNNMEDGVFRVSEYTIHSMPDTGVKPYTISYIDPADLPVVPA